MLLQAVLCTGKGHDVCPLQQTACSAKASDHVRRKYGGMTERKRHWDMARTCSQTVITLPSDFGLFGIARYEEMTASCTSHIVTLKSDATAITRC